MQNSPIALRHPARSSTRTSTWCGPFALAVITGLSYDDAYAKSLAVEKRRLRTAARRRNLAPNYWTDGLSIKSMHANAFKRTAERLGIVVKWAYELKDQPTLLTFTRQHTVKDRVYVVSAGNHYEVICNGILYHSHHDPMPVEDAPRYRMARVKKWTEVKPRPAALREA